MSPVVVFIRGDTKLLFGKTCAVASVELHTEHGIKVSDMIFKRWKIILPAYTLYELIIKVMVHTDQIAAVAKLDELPIGIFQSCTVSLQCIIGDTQNLRNAIREDSPAVDILQETFGWHSVFKSEGGKADYFSIFVKAIGCYIDNYELIFHISLLYQRIHAYNSQYSYLFHTLFQLLVHLSFCKKCAKP